MTQKDGLVRCWGFITSDQDAVNPADTLKAMRGLVGIHYASYGTVLIFDNENDAKIARNILEYEHCNVAKLVLEAFLHEKDYQKAIENWRKAK